MDIFIYIYNYVFIKGNDRPPRSHGGRATVKEGALKRMWEAKNKPMKMLQKRTEGHIIWGQRGAGEIRGD